MHHDANFRSGLRRRRWVVAGVAGLIGLVVALLVWEREPVVNGRTVTEWAVIKAGVKPVPAGGADVKDAEKALQQAGKAAAPALARLLKARESGWYGKFVLWSRGKSWFPWHPITAREKRWAGLAGLFELGTNAAPVLPEIASFEPKGHDNERYSHDLIVSNLARKESVNPFDPGDVMASVSWIYPSPSKSHSTFVCAAFGVSISTRDEYLMVIGLRHTDGRLLDWIELRRNSQLGGGFFLLSARQADGEGFEVRTQGYVGRPMVIKVTSSGTNFTSRLETAESVFRFRVVNDRFVFPPADGK